MSRKKELKMNDTKRQIIYLVLYAASSFILFIANFMFGGSNMIIAALNMYTFIKLLISIKKLINPTTGES